MGGPSTLPETLSPRLAGVEDLDKLIEFGHKFHARSPWSHVPFNDYKMKTVLLEMIADEDAVVIMHDHGVIGGSIITPFFTDTLVAQELFWYADKEGGALLDAFEAWAYVEGAEVISMAHTAIRPKALDRLYQQRGYYPRETFYVKEFED